MSNNHARIIENLSGRVHGINTMATLSGTDMDFDALNELIAAGRVRREYVRVPDGRDRVMNFETFKLNPRLAPELSVV